MVQGKVVVASLSDQVYEILRRHIVERKIAPTKKIEIDSLAQELGVSRTPILDALTRLEAEGLITRRNRVGTYVAPVNQQIMDEIFEAREMIEGWAAAPAIARLTEDDLVELRATMELARQATEVATDEDFDYLEFTRYDERFHTKLIALCGNSRIMAMYAALNSHMQIARVYSLRALARSRESYIEHMAILAAYAARDVAAAVEAQRNHVERSRAGVNALLAQHGIL